MAVKQVIVVNKGLGMSKGKMAAQVSHASMAFITRPFLNHTGKVIQVYENNELIGYEGSVFFDKDTYEQWLCGIFTKVILEVKNNSQLENVVAKAKENGMVENKDFFCIRDACLTELTPDETGTCFTCIGFRPMPAEEIDKVTKKLQLFKE